jgi:protocatechuate 3,4-dioxygenase alpha subunit
MTRTPSQTVGPYYAIGLCRGAQNELVSPDDPAALRLSGRLLDGQDEPITDGMVEIWDAEGGRWGRSGTDAGGTFAFVVSEPASHFDVHVFARGLLRHQLTRIYLSGAGTAGLASLDEEQRARLVARRDGRDLRFDIRMQGDNATVFFAH